MPTASLPVTSSPGIAALLSITVGFITTTHAFWRGASREDIQWAGFFGAYLGAGIGLSVYCIHLIGELY